MNTRTTNQTLINENTHAMRCTEIDIQDITERSQKAQDWLNKNAGRRLLQRTDIITQAHSLDEVQRCAEILKVLNKRKDELSARGQELRSQKASIEVLDEVERGATTINEIKEKTGLSTSCIHTTLKELIRLDSVECDMTQTHYFVKPRTDHDIAVMSGLTRYSNESYTHQDSYSTVELLGGQWTVLAIDNAILTRGTMAECVAYLTNNED